ncbi:MAG TPA: diacylglycerol kinase family protein [Flavobacteriaceae bacterium]|nr:diacylglycerol kinase family protein [Flavobacteriaceae bacterium]
MKNPNDSFLKGRIRSLKFAFKGAFLLLTTEHSIMVQFSLGILVTILGFVMDISATEWMFQLIAVGMVLVAESLNTGIEKLCDFVHIEYHERIGFIKDISAGAATFAAIIALIVGLIIYIPKFI